MSDPYRCTEVLLVGDGLAVCERPSDHQALHVVHLAGPERIGDVMVAGEVWWGSEPELAAAQERIRHLYADSRSMLNPPPEASA